MSNLKKVKNRTNQWIVGFYVAPRQRKWKRVRGDRATAERIQRHLQNQADLQRTGVVDPATARASEQAPRPLADHIREFVEHVRARGRAKRYVAQVQARLERFVKFASINLIGAVTAEKADAFTMSLRYSRASGFTVNEYVGTLKAFTKWAAMTSRLLSDPLACVRKSDGRSITKKRPRRALAPGDIGSLLGAAQARPLLELRTIRHGPRKGTLVGKVRPEVMAAAKALGHERALAYLLALWTGLRRSELGALERRDVELDTLPPRILLRAHTTKSKRGDSVVLHPQVAAALREAMPADASPTARVLGAVPGMKVLKADLKLAGIAYATPAGRVDLHAMRKSLATFLAVHAVPPRIAQSHMRHTDPRLTAVTYTDESLLPTASVIGVLPWLPTAAPVPGPRRAAGAAGA